MSKLTLATREVGQIDFYSYVSGDTPSQMLELAISNISRNYVESPCFVCKYVFVKMSLYAIEPDMSEQLSKFGN